MFNKPFVVLTSAFLFACSPAHAETAKQDNCSTLSTIAEAIMKSRQLGIPMAKVYQLALNSEDKNLSLLLTKMITAAYEEPRFSTPEYQKKAISDFGSDVFLACLKYGV